jgi:hypothetical protein
MLNNRKDNMQKQHRIRLNTEYRNKIANRMRIHLEQEDTQEKSKYIELKANFKALQDKTWELAKQVVSRQYPKEDVDMAHYLQDKYANVNTIAKDSCFHFGYMKTKEKVDEQGNILEEDDKYETKHFDFKIGGDINGIDRQEREGNKPNLSDSGQNFAYAYFRDELKAQEGCNPDINVEMLGKDRNPHEQKYQDANDKYLGMNSSYSNSDNLTSYSAQWDNDYELDLIGREYCRDRQIAVSKEEFQVFLFWQQAKGQLIIAHQKWIESILNQMKEIKLGLKGYRYLDEAIELCTELGLSVNDAEIIRVNSTGLTIYNPKNLADRIKGMKNKNISREDKIKARLLYEHNQAKSMGN